MGYAIIKDLNNSEGYALNRLIQNLIPKDSSKRGLLASGTTFAYSKVSDSMYKLSAVNLVCSETGKVATQPYVYKLANGVGGTVINSQTGVSLDEISGVITLSATYDGAAVFVKMVPLTDATYYTTAANISAILAILAGETSIHNYTLSVTYNNGQTVSAAGTNAYNMTSFSLKDNGTEVVSYSNIVPSNLSISENVNWIDSTDPKALKIQANGNTTSATARSGNVLVSYNYNGKTVSTSVTVNLSKAYLTSVSNLSYSGSTDVGESISLTGISATGTWDNGATQLINPTSIKLNGNSVNTIQSGNNTYTCYFGKNASNIDVTGNLNINGTSLLHIVDVEYRVENNTSVPYVKTSTMSNSDPYITYSAYKSLSGNKVNYNIEIDPVISSTTDTTANKLSCLNDATTLNSTSGVITYNDEAISNGEVLVVSHRVTFTNADDASDEYAVEVFKPNYTNLSRGTAVAMAYNSSNGGISTSNYKQISGGYHNTASILTTAGDTYYITLDAAGGTWLWVYESSASSWGSSVCETEANCRYAGSGLFNGDSGIIYKAVGGGYLYVSRKAVGNVYINKITV